MARKPAKPTTPPPEDEDLGDEAMCRLGDARAQKVLIEADLEEAYYFAAPWRVRTQSSYLPTKNQHPNDADELQTSLGFEVADEFMTMLIDSFLQLAARWAERKADPYLPPGVQKQVEQQIKPQDEAIFAGIRASNFHAELAKQGVPDAAIGVIAMLVDDPGRGKPVRCIGIPIRELEMNLGPDGRVDDRFVVRDMKYRQLKSQLPDVKDFPEEIAKHIDEDPDDMVQVVWGWWRDWDRTDDEVWQHVVLVDEELVHDAMIVGEGSCQLVLGRFGSLPDFAWPQGPLLKSLPDLRVIDETDAAFIENLDFTLRPPFAFDDDGVLGSALEDGIEPGKGYPRRPGSTRDSIEKIWQPNPVDAAMFQHEARQRRVRRLHYIDFPEQPGKTPPTATQWLDEMIQAQKKIGTPGYAFWREFPYEAFQRFRYLAEKRGAIKPIEVNGVRVTLQAYNPAARAQENQEILNASRLMQIAASAFPQVWQAAANGLETLQNVQKKMDDKIVVFNTPQDFQGAVDTLAKLGGVRGLQGGGLLQGAGGAAAPTPTGPPQR